MKKIFETIREKFEIGPILTYEEIEIVKELIDIHDRKKINEMLEYAFDKKFEARMNSDYEKFDSYSNAASKMTRAINYLLTEEE